MDFLPAYSYLTQAEWQAKISASEKILACCTMCPRKCGVDRIAGQKGWCQSGFLPQISCVTIHHGEEPVISGSKGAGNLFFANCNLHCAFCQNHEISHNTDNSQGHNYTTAQLANTMLDLQQKGVHCIGLVSPTHFALQLLPAIKMANEKGLKIPLVYNSNGYDSVETLAILEGIIDIYLPDCKYGSDLNGAHSGVKDYFSQSKKAILEMYRQLGKRLVLENSIAVRGLIIRHLVLPNNQAESKEVLKFIAGELTPEIHLSLMSQYYPAYLAKNIPILNRAITASEYSQVTDFCAEFGIENGWFQTQDSSKCYRPDFSDTDAPFKNDLD